MDNLKTAEWAEVRRPIESLLSKSEKAQQKLKPGTWQHSMLRENVKALRIAAALMDERSESKNFTQEELQESLRAIASMITKTENTLAKFAPKTSQHTLQRNRLKALRMAQKLIKNSIHA